MIRRVSCQTAGFNYKVIRQGGINVKIAVVVNDLELSEAGGVGSFVYELCKAFLRANQNLMIIGVINKGNNKNDNMTKELIAMGAFAKCLNASSQKDALLRLPTITVNLRHLLNEYSKGDKIICNVHLKLSALIGSFASINSKNIYVVETYHSQYSHYRLQTKIMSPIIKRVICCSDSAYEEYVHTFGRKNIVCSIPNGINMEAIRSLCQSNKKCTGIFKFCSVGRLSYQKNFSISIKAFLNTDVDNVEYCIIGDGEDKQKLKAIIGDSNRIKLIGSLKRKDVLQQIANADMIVMPSLWEGLSIFQLEALALGCPMMLSDISAFRQVFHEEALREDELFRRCEWGYLVETNNMIAWEKAIKHFCENSYLSAEMHNKMLEISREYDISMTLDKYLVVFNETIGG